MSISSVVGRDLAWDRRKSNANKGDYWAACPFHGEKTPSFHADDKKGRYYCFGCKVSGDIFTYMVERKGMGFIEAVELLAQEAGVALPKITAEDRHKEEVRRTLHDVLELAAVFYEQTLTLSAGANARTYLSGRDISPVLQREFRIGYAPTDKMALRNHLTAKSVTPEQMIEAGLLVSGEGIAVPYDRFRDRIMFPIKDSRGRAIAFGGRALSKTAMAKYLNSPETVLFKKGMGLYNFDRARPDAHRSGQLLVVEGYIDVIAMHRAGLISVAPLGTALTADQMALLWRMVPEPVLCFDGDGAGIKAAWRAADLAVPLVSPGRGLQFVFLPDGLDPDELLRRSGPEALRAAVTAAKPLLDVLWDRALQANDRSTPERAAQFERDLWLLVDQVTDSTVRNHYRQALRGRLRALFDTPLPPRARQRTPGNGLWRVGRPASELKTSLSAMEKATAASRLLRDEGCSDV